MNIFAAEYNRSRSARGNAIEKTRTTLATIYSRTTNALHATISGFPCCAFALTSASIA